MRAAHDSGQKRTVRSEPVDGLSLIQNDIQQRAGHNFTIIAHIAYLQNMKMLVFQRFRRAGAFDGCIA
jgi:hypothetical protein